MTPRRPTRGLLVLLLIVALALAAAGGWWLSARGLGGGAGSLADAGASKPSDAAAGARRPANPHLAAATFVGSEACAGCHAEATAAWRSSQHARAMQHATPQTVLGDFSGAKFRHDRIESTFFRRDGRFFVRTDGADGRLADFEVRYTFGLEPLQQYLVEFPDGRIQALSIAWDSRSKAQGGQRWFHLYPGEKVDWRDELHWTRASQNWNYMCADCHSTNVRRNYDAAKNTFGTAWSEISVGCEACHGPASAHLEWAKTKSSDPTRGLTAALDERRGVAWTIDPATGNARRSRPRETSAEMDVCAQCHARRSQVAEGYRAGAAFLDHYRPALLETGLYYADGQQRDEVYTWGSFLQSRMHHAGVTCADCHEPHGGKLRAQGNALCSQCHLAAKYDAAAHTHHAGGAGTQCVECHMPATTYMVIDPRRDHSLRVPRPDLSVSLGVPNACNRCHADRDAKWAAATVQQWYGHTPGGFQRHAAAFGAVERSAADAAQSLVAVIADREAAPIARATAFEFAGRFASESSVQAARAALFDADPLVRRGGIAALAVLPPQDRLASLAPLLADPVRTVRLDAADSLADALEGAGVEQRAAFDRVAAEIASMHRLNADRPESRVAFGNFQARRGRFADAKASFEAALALDPQFVPAYANLADLYRAQGSEGDAEKILREGLERAGDDATLHHALGLTLVRRQETDAALAELAKATRLAPGDARFAYVYAVALQSRGELAAAMRELDRALARHPDDRELLLAAAEYGGASQGEPYARRLAERYGSDPAVAQFLARRSGHAGAR
jgi:tetratricopeptide (TPR) repeat protein